MIFQKIFVKQVLFTLIFSMVGLNFVVASTSPQNVHAKKVGFTTVLIEWSQPENALYEAFKVYRDGVELAEVLEAKYTDSNLTSGTAYSYTVTGVSGDQISELSNSCAITTLGAPKDQNISSDAVKLTDSLIAVDNENGEALLATLVEELKSLLGVSSVDYESIDPALVEKLAENILSENKKEEPLNVQERLILEEELSLFLNDHFSGNSFTDIFIYKQLTALAEDHFQANKIKAAKSLYEYSLNYLANHEVAVFLTLSRLAYIEASPLNENSSISDITWALEKSRAQYMRFFDFFPESKSAYAKQAYLASAIKAYTFFSRVLDYSVYDADFYNQAIADLNAAIAIGQTDADTARLDRFSGWELGEVSISFHTLAGIAGQGNITLRNSSYSDVAWGITAPVDSRTISSGPGGEVVSVPVYMGHTYALDIEIVVPDSAPLRYSLSALPLAPGVKIVLAPNSEPQFSLLADPTSPAEVHVLTDEPSVPYNLSAERFFDSFTLSWEWKDQESLEATGFVVYRGGVELATVTESELQNIPVEGDSFVYEVAAQYSNGSLSGKSYPLEVAPAEITTEHQAYLDWKQEHFADQSALAGDDPDSDGLTNLQEYVLGTNPNQAPGDDSIRERLDGVLAGMHIVYYESNWFNLSTIEPLDPIGSDQLTDISFYDNSKEILTSGKSDDVGFSARGFLDIKTAGEYTFSLISDNGAALIIDTNTVVKVSGYYEAVTKANSVYLHKGVHEIHIPYYERYDVATFQLYWEGPGFSKRPFDFSQVYYTSQRTAELDEALSWQLDRDADSLRDLDEVAKYGTDVTKKDTDGDGLSDGEEVIVYSSNPLRIDSDSDGFDDYVEEVRFLTDANKPEFLFPSKIVFATDISGFEQVRGAWKSSRGILTSQNIRGELVIPFEVAIANTGMSLVHFRADIISHTLTTERLGTIRLYLDNEYVGAITKDFEIRDGQSFYWMLPNLSAGEHVLRIEWENVHQWRFLGARSLTITGYDGLDEDGDSLEDWEEARLNKMAGILNSPAQVASATSPFCLEGKAAFHSKVNLSSNTVLQRGSGNDWFSNIALPEDGSVLPVTVKFQDGFVEKEVEVSWGITDALTSSDLVIRKGDALRLAIKSDVEGVGKLKIGNDSLNAVVNVPEPIVFDKTGEFAVTASLDIAAMGKGKKGETIANSFVIKVVEAAVPENLVEIWRYKKRSWKWVNLPEQAHVEADGLSLLEIDENTAGKKKEKKEKKNNKAGYVDRVFEIGRDEIGSQQNIVARIGEAGPILATVPTNGEWLRAVVEGKLVIEKTYPDGAVLMTNRIFVSNITENTKVRIHIFKSGVVLDDGTVERIITKEDFDEFGRYSFSMIRPASVEGSTCHNIFLYEGDTEIGNR